MNRCKFHFTPQTGWLNDPNGTIYYAGKYHLFYQHYPKDIVWGPMHWGHATTEDFLAWTEHEIALCPDEMGYIFSGSCVVDTSNLSGLGTSEHPALLAFFTSHNPVTEEQQQSMAYSLDGYHFTKCDRNPLISNRKDMADFKKDFRDPKVFSNPILGGYSMVLAAGDVLFFYHTNNFFDWEKTGEFDPLVHGLKGTCECPDCFLLDGKWILSLSTVLEHAQSVMQYFVGYFDGKTFVNEDEGSEPLLLDYGPDDYAMVTFTDSKLPLAIGWGENWHYVSHTPATTYRGKMTIPCTMKLLDTNRGLRIAFAPMGEVAKQRYTVAVGEELSLVNSYGHTLSIRVSEDTIVVDRSNAGDLSFAECMQQPKYQVYQAKRYTTDACTLEVLEDEGYYEIFAEEGLNVFRIMTW